MVILWTDVKPLIYPWRSGDRLRAIRSSLFTQNPDLDPEQWGLRRVFCLFVFFLSYIVLWGNYAVFHSCMFQLHHWHNGVVFWLSRSSGGGLEETGTPLTCAWKQEAVVYRPGRAAAIIEVGSSHGAWFTCSTMQSQLKIM